MGLSLWRGLSVATALLVLGAGVTFSACGLDENGTQTTDDGAVGVDVVIGDGGPAKDVVVDNQPPPVVTCEEAGAALDASCLGQAVPTGWTPMGYQAGANVACPSADFTAYPLVMSPQLPPGACNCTGCAATGNWSCGVTLNAGSNCTNESKDGGASFCWQNVNHQSFDQSITRYGNPTCGGGQQVGFQDASTAPLSVCVPKSCETDYCGLGASGFKLCIYNAAQSDGGCPAGFPNSHLVAQSASVTCDSCQACALSNANTQCTGLVTAYNGNNCDQNALGSTTANNTCVSASGNYGSLYFDAGPVPVPNCGPPSGPATGKAQLVGPGTICCTQ